MFIERKQDLSVYYFIKQVFEDEGALFVTVVDDFPDSNLSVPSVSIVNHTLGVRELELGNRKGYDVRTWFIDVFAENKSQRDDYAYLIKNKIQEGIPVYDYDEGFPPTVSPTQLGVLGWREVEITPIRVFSELVSTLYWRAQIRLLAVYSKST